MGKKLIQKHLTIFCLLFLDELLILIYFTEEMAVKTHKLRFTLGNTFQMVRIRGYFDFKFLRLYV